jgi:superfamily II DNA/RNA helicase
MIILANAQSILAKDIDGIIDVIMRGLEFGITIINRSLPFVIQNIILDNLRTKNMGIVFASESMSMGINYALRSVIIKSPKDLIRINPSKLIQMGGRCGRRGKDNQAHIIYWGIENSYEAHSDFIDPVIYPEHFIMTNENNSKSKEDLAMQLGAIFNTLYFKEEKTKSEDLKKHEKKMEQIKKNTRTYTKVVEIISTDEDDEENRIKKRSTDIKLNRSQYLEPTIFIVSSYLKYSESEINSIVNLICKLDSDIVLDSFSIDSYTKSRDINLLMHVIIELHNTYAMSTSVEFLNYLEKVVNILQTCEYRLIKLAK